MKTETTINLESTLYGFSASSLWFVAVLSLLLLRLGYLYVGNYPLKAYELPGKVLGILVVVFLLTVGAMAALNLVLGAIRLDRNSNKLMTQLKMERNSHIFRAKFKDPDSFDDYVFVFDPNEVHFDWYSVNYSRRDGTRNSGEVYNKGAVFPDDPSKRVISMPRAARANTRRYAQPRSSRAKNFVSSIITTFAYTRKDESEEVYQELLAKFQALATKGQFMIKRRSNYKPVERSSGRYVMN